jgi:hypothetical protein
LRQVAIGQIKDIVGGVEGEVVDVLHGIGIDAAVELGEFVRTATAEGESEGRGFVHRHIKMSRGSARMALVSTVEALNTTNTEARIGKQAIGI